MKLVHAFTLLQSNLCRDCNFVLCKQGLEDPQIRNEMLKLVTQKQGEF